jgi:hypothetical protein
MRASVLCVVFGLSLACSSAEREPTPRSTANQTEPETSERPAKPPKQPSFDQRAPMVGDPAPAISLATLAGSRVTLPMSNADRAAVLIFGSFS